MQRRRFFATGAIAFVAVTAMAGAAACGSPPDASVPDAMSLDFEEHSGVTGQANYIKASNTDADDRFGRSVALSASGDTLAVIGRFRPRNGSYVFAQSGDSWAEQAFLEGTSGAPYYGFRVALSARGDTLAVGALGKESGSGAPVLVFTRTGGSWSQQATVGADIHEVLGPSVALSASGDILAVGGPFEHSGATGVDGDPADSSAEYSGAVYVFRRRGSTWAQQAYVKASNTDAHDWFGVNVALSASGDTLAVGAITESSSATGVDGDQTDNSSSGSGAVYVFTRTGSRWAQQAYVKAANTGARDHFGSSVALSASGDTLAVGTGKEESSATGVDGAQEDDSARRSGAVYVFTSTDSIWAQQAYVKASNTGAEDRFGESLALSASGDTLAVAASWEDSSATGVDGDQADNSAHDSGAVYMFRRTDGTWAQHAYVKAANTDEADRFGTSVALSASGGTLAVGAPEEDSSATGMDGDQADNSAFDSGAVYVFH